VHGARTGLWGGRMGNHRLYPAPDWHSASAPCQQVMPGVDMTSDVKSGLPIFSHGLRPMVLRPSAEAEPVRDDG
jgi:hypothetical protein